MNLVGIAVGRKWLARLILSGPESQGMVLMAEDPDGNLAPISAEAMPGSVIR